MVFLSSLANDNKLDFVNNSSHLILACALLSLLEHITKCLDGPKSRIRRIISKTPLTYGIEAEAVVPRETSDIVNSFSFSSHAFSMNFSRYLLAFRSLTTSCSSLLRCLVLDGKHLVRSMRVFTTALLFCAGLCQSNDRYLLVCVALRYTLFSSRSSERTVILASSKKNVG